MTQETFELALKHKDILWNDMVILTIYNPQYKGKNRWWQFWKPVIPRLVTLEGALGYHRNDTIVNICVSDGEWKTKELFFTFNEIYDITKMENYDTKRRNRTCLVQ